MERLIRLPKEYLLLLTLIILILGVSIYTFFQSQPSTLPNDYTTKITPSGISLEKEENNVSVTVEYLPDKSGVDVSAFNVVLDTHSENLDNFNFQTDLYLEKDGSSFLPVTFNQSGSGHHRKAQVAFKKASVPYTIILQNLAQVARREFKFEN